MLFLCIPMIGDFLGPAAITSVLLFYYPFIIIFLNISNKLLSKAKIREDIVKIIK